MIWTHADFIYAGYSLPFCSLSHFDEVWMTIVSALRPRGRFAGQLFGVRDEWASNTTMNLQTHYSHSLLNTTLS